MKSRRKQYNDDKHEENRGDERQNRLTFEHFSQKALGLLHDKREIHAKGLATCVFLLFIQQAGP